MSADRQALASNLEATADRLQTEAVGLREAARSLRAFDADPAPASPTRLLTAPEVAKLLGIPLSSVWALGRNGGAGVVRIGRRMLFSEHSLCEWQREKAA